MAATVIGLLLGACEGEFASDPTHPRSLRAVQNPYDNSSGNNEVMTASTGAIPIVAVDFAGTKDDKPKVTTILDPLHLGAATQPATAPATRPGAAPGTVEFRPITNTMQVRVESQRRADDAFGLGTDNEGNVHLAITSPTGIGSVTLERTGESWPAVIHVTLQHAAGKPFTGLEGFSAAEVTEQGRRVDLKSAVQKTEGTADITIPGFVRGPRVIIDWVDAYR